MTHFSSDAPPVSQRSFAAARRIAFAAFLASMVVGCGATQEVPDSANTVESVSMVADPDDRTTLLLPVQGRHMVLMEMRVMLSSVQAYVAAAATGDTAGMRAAAQASGMAAARDMDPAMEQKLPPEFLRLGMSTHAAWDSLAMDVSQGVSTDKSLARLGTIMSNCIACHSQFRIDVAR